MFTYLHSSRVALFSLGCAIFFLNALPTVVRSEEDLLLVDNTVILDGASASTTESTSTPTTAEAAPVENLNPYPVERVPGDNGTVIGDFVVGPGKADVTIAPGKSQVTYMTVTNRTGERRRFDLTVEDTMGAVDPKAGIVLLGDDRGPYSLKDYIKMPAMSFELGQNERARVPVTISIPKDAEPGGLYGSVLVNTVAIEAVPGDSGGTAPQSAIVARIGTLFFITIPGDTNRDGSLLRFSTVPEKKFYQHGPMTFGIFTENRGSIHLAPYGEIRIYNMLDEEVGAVELEPWFVLPQSERLREVTWNREFLFGRYVAKVSINRGYDNIIDEGEYTFWVLPWKIVLAVFSGLFVIIFLMRAFFRTFEFKRKSN